MLCSKYLLLTLSIIVTIGCGGTTIEKYEVRGKVVCDGAVVPTGMVAFVPERAGKRVTASIGAGGEYRVLAPAGNYRVAVVAVEEMPPQDINKDNWKEAFTTTRPKHYVPQAYSDTETSGLSYMVKPDFDGNTYDISITTRDATRRQP
jgi:hypothetical protein